jgi:YggT family protein
LPSLPPLRYMDGQDRAGRGLFMVPLIGFIALVINLYIWVVIASAILSWLIAFNVVNTSNRLVYTIAEGLYRVTEPALRPIRNILPNLGGIDISPVILILLLLFIRDVVLFGWILPAVI